MALKNIRPSAFFGQIQFNSVIVQAFRIKHYTKAIKNFIDIVDVFLNNLDVFMAIVKFIITRCLQIVKHVGLLFLIS